MDGSIVLEIPPNVYDRLLVRLAVNDAPTKRSQPLLPTRQVTLTAGTYQSKDNSSENYERFIRVAADFQMKFPIIWYF